VKCVTARLAGGTRLEDVSFHMTTDAVPIKDRTAMTREVFGRQFLRVEVEELDDAPLHVDLKLRALPGLRMIEGAVRGARATRTGPLMADGNDDVFLTLNLSGSYNITQRNYDVTLTPGDAHIAGCDMPSTYLRPGGTALGLRMPRSALASRVDGLEDRLGSRLPGGNPALTLLQGYTGILEDGPTTPELVQLAVPHIYDLVALSMGAKANSDRDAQRTSLNAARLRAIQKYIAANLIQPDLGISQIAAWQRITPRQVQRLFERDGTTFSRYLLGSRLAHAHAALGDPLQAHKSISQIIFDSGFGDVSGFNHAFRRRYGSTPSEVRHRDILQADLTV
jgi:AraC-like DNA-binding protein